MSNASSKCAACSKTAAERGIASLNKCAKCKTTAYCNRDCQKADWKTHKKICAKQANANVQANIIHDGTAPVLKDLEQHVPNPFTRLDQGKYLHDRPKQDVYKLLIDSFRMRQQDEMQHEHKTTPNSLYTGAESSIEPFRKYLAEAVKRLGLLPPWWTPETQRECEEFGESGAWNDLRKKVMKDEMIAHYGDQKVPMQLRMLADAIVGRGLNGQDGTPMRKMLAQQEAGGLPDGSKIRQEYIGDPEKTASTFIQPPAWRNSLVNVPGPQRFYKTGDLGRLRKDGSLELIGRKDNQVKLRGQRIELGEIENQARMANTDTREIIVELIKRPEAAESQLACFIVVNDGADAVKEDGEQKKLDEHTKQAIHMIQERLDRFLPQYMVPTAFIPISHLPLTWSRKIDRKQLRDIGASISNQQLADLQASNYSANRQLSEKEKELQWLWALVLGIETNSIGLYDSFFRLGGDSIAAMKLVVEARKKDLQLTVASIFRFPKLVDLASWVNKGAPAAMQNIAAFSLLECDSDEEKKRIRDEVAANCNLSREEIQDLYPGSPLQEGLISLTLKRPGDYVMQSVLKLRDSIDEAAFRKAWENVVLSSPLLRTRIVQHRKGILQAVVADGIQWIEADSLVTYQARDKSIPMGLGTPLARYALVKEHGNRWFVWTIHHALYDGWSLPRIVSAVETAYNGASIPKHLGFNVFIRYIREQDQGEAERYWQAAFAGCEATSFPPLPPTVQQPIADAMVEYQCPELPNIVSDITISSLLRAAWAIVVGSYTSSGDIVYGATVTGRNAPVAGIETMLGPAIATVPVRIRIPKEDTVPAFLKTVQQQATDMIMYEQTGLQRIARMGADAQRACSFQTLLVVQLGQGLEENKELGTWQSSVDLQDFTTYALMLQCTLSGQSVHLTASFDPRVIDQWQVERILGQFSFVMHQLAQAEANSESTIADITVLTPDNRRQLWTWNETVPAAVEQSIPELFSAQANHLPDALAIQAWDGELTYSELDDLSSRLASYLVHEKGLEREEIVPLCFEKSMWTIVAMFAVLKAGGAFTPLDPDHPASRHEEIFRQTHARIVLTSEKYSKRCQSTVRAVVEVGSNSVRRLQCKRDDTLLHAGLDQRAYILFTSGSTGLPKGVTIEHRAFATSCTTHGKAFGMSPYIRALQFTPYTADISIAEIFTTLLYGGCVCVISDEERKDSLMNAIQKMRVNWAYLTPTVARLLDPNAVSTLETVLLGGEPVSSGECEKWTGKVLLINTYGPTECSVLCSAFFGIENFYTGLIGSSIASVSWVVDPNNHDKLSPLGAVGELLVEGPIVGRGYLNDEEKTAAAFISDPVWLLEGSEQLPGQGRHGRLYKTGDLVRYDKNGNLVSVGRKDTQVKVRGQRVELEEIEHHLRECMPDAKQIAVEVILPGGEKEKAVVAAFLQLEEGAPTEDMLASVFFPVEVDRRLSERLPSYMVPAVYFKVCQLPMTTSGKINRKQLRETGASFSAQYLAELQTRRQGPKRQPSSEKEKLLQELWAQVLNIDADSIGMDDSFFRLGGDSITAMQVSSIARSLQISVSTGDILRHKTIGRLVRHSTSTLVSPKISFEDPTNKLFGLTPIQDLYLRIESSGKAYFDQCFLFELSWPIDFKLLCLSFQTLVQRHSILRARFESTTGGRWHQQICDSTDSSFVVEEAQGTDNDGIRQAICQSRCRLDAQNGPTLAAVLFDAGQRQFLSVAIHHLVIDLVSWRILLQELEDLLLSQPLPPAPQIPFQAWQALQAEHASKGERVMRTAEDKAIVGQQLSYWGVQSHDILLGHVTTIDFTLDKQTSSNLLGSCNDAFQTRPIELMLAALVNSFATIFPDRALPTIFNESHGRETWDDSIDLSRTLGWFTSMSPVTLPSYILGDLLDFIRHTKDQMRTFTDNGRSYFASCFKDAETADIFASMFPVEIMFNYQGMYQQFERKNSLFKNLPIPAGSEPEAMAMTPRFALFDVSVAVQNECMHVSVAYDRRVDHQQQIKDWIDQYKVNLIQMEALLREKSREWTLSDLPASFQSYQDVDLFQKRLLPELGVQPEEVEDVYPCLPMQEGILISQSKDRSAYWVSIIFEALPIRHDQVSCAQLQQAWKSVVRRHSLLRTIFVSMPGSPGTMNVILKDPQPSISIFEAAGDTATIEMFSAHQDTISYQGGSLQHHISICKLDNGKIYLCLKINHAIFDAHSRGIILRDLQTAYNSELSQDAAQFKDAVSYLAKQKDDTEARTYWATYLDDVEPCSFPLIADTKTTDGRNGMARVSGVDAKAIYAFCETWDVTPATIIQTAWALVLSRYTGSPTPCFGNLSSRRDLPLKDVENILDPLITILTCRVRLGEGQTVLDVLRTVQSDFTSSIPHQRFPLANIHNMLGLGTSRLFNTILSLQRIEDGVAEDTPNVLFSVQEGTDPTEYDIMIGAAYDRSTMNIDINYQTHCINQSQASTLAESFGRAINTIITEPTSTMNDLEILSANQRLQIWDWNGEVPIAVERCVHDMFAEQAKAQPLAQAICAWDGDMSYGELDKLSSSLSEHLVSLGITSDVIVPLCFEKSIWTVVAMIAVLKAGGAFTPLDPEYPSIRHAQIIQQTKAKVVLASARYSEFCRSNHSMVVTVSKASILQLPHEVSKEMNPRPNMSTSDSAYVFFTSGSTGTPKGVIIEHKAISTSCLAQGKAFQLSHDTRCLQYANYTFDACITEILAILIHGGCICVPSDEDRRNNLSGIVNTLNANFALLTATVAHILDPEAATSLKTLVLGGEQVNSVDWDKWQKLEKRINTYGPTECSVWCTSHSNEDGFTSGMIGKAMACVSWIVDPNNHNKLAPMNSTGELLIEGSILARGYLDDEEKTNAAFVYDPPWLLEGSTQHPGRHGRLYKTGDLVRYNSDGSLVYIGRKDTQVKVRGQRVELGEIEHYVRQYLDVEQMAVEVIVPGNDKTKSTVAVFVQQEEEELIDDNPSALTGNDPSVRVFFAADVDQQLSKQLPSYMVPTVYFSLAQLPTTTSGKMDRKQLRKIGASFSVQQLAELRSRGPKEKPSTELEKTLQQLWARVLDIETDQIGLDDSFLHLGGDSVGAMKLVAEARKHDVTLTTAKIFKTPILRDMARTAKPLASSFQQPSNFSQLAPDLYKAIFSGQTQCDPPISLDAVEDIDNVSFVQELTLKLGEQNPRAAFTHFYFDLSPSLSAELVENSCQVLTEQFATLRTHFAYFEGRLLQFVLRKIRVPFAKFEVTESIEEATKDVILQDIQQSSTLGVITSFMFVRNSPKAARLIVRLSHAQYDGVALQVVVEALASLLRREPLRPAVNFSTYMAYSRQRAAESTRYWKNLLKGSRLTEITPILSSATSKDEAPRNIDLVRSISIKQLPKGITTASLVSAAWAVIVSHIGKVEDVTYVHVVGGRNSDIPGIEEIVGPCVNMIPVRTEVSRTRTVGQLLHSIQEQQVGLQESDSMGFNDIVQKCTDWPAGTTLDTVINHNINTAPGADVNGDRLKLQVFNNPFHVTARIAVLWELQDGKLTVILCGNTHFFTNSCAQRLLDTICETVTRLTSDLNVTLDVFQQALPSFP